jgi:dienelactone hydrolase
MKLVARYRTCLLSPAVLAMAIASLSPAMPAHASQIEETIKVAVKVKDNYGRELAQDIDVIIHADDSTPEPRPILLLGHGRSVSPVARAGLGRNTYLANARWFARLGFLVAVPIRLGYGQSGGEDVEDSGDCRHKHYPPAYAAAADQMLRVLDALRERADAAKDRAVIAGQSFGGATAVTIAARNPPGVQAAVNFAGGGGGNPVIRPQSPCNPGALEQMFGSYGKTARLPTLWIYTENDQWMGARYPKQWFDAFVQAGGIGEFRLYPPHGKDGHPLFTAAPRVWHREVLDFLRVHGYPALKEGDVGAEQEDVRESRQ